MLARHYREMLDYHREIEPEPEVYPTKITRSLVEEFSGEAFEYEEFLNQYVDYTPDPMPAGVGPFHLAPWPISACFSSIPTDFHLFTKKFVHIYL